MGDLASLSGLEPALTLHLLTALVALALGPFAIYRRSRDAAHKALGYAWVTAMAACALSSFWLHAALMELAMGFGAIHLLSLYVLIQLGLGLRDARAGRIPAHRARMAGLYWQALSVAGLLTLLPGRVLNEALFGARPEIGLWVAAGVGAGLSWVLLGRILRAPAAPARLSQPPAEAPPMPGR